MPIGTIHAPGGKVVAVENNYGRIIVGDSWAKLIARAAITGLVAGLVLLFGKYAIAGVAAWFALVLAWLFKRQPLREVPAVGGAATAKVLVAVAAAAALTAAPPIVKTQVIAAPGPGPGSSSPPIDAGVVTPDPIDAGLDAPVDAGVALDLSRARVMVASRDYPGACATVQTAARPPAGVEPALCAGTGAHALFADMDDVVVYVDYGAQGAITVAQLAASQPAIQVLADGVDITATISPGARRTSGRLVGGHAVYTIAFRAPAVRAAAFTVVASLGDRSIAAESVRLRDYPKPFKVALIECAQKRSPRGTTCALDVAHMADRATLFVRRRTGDAAPVTIAQRLDRAAYDGAAVSPLVDELATIAPLPRRGTDWVIVTTVGGVSQSTSVKLTRAP